MQFPKACPQVWDQCLEICTSQTSQVILVEVPQTTLRNCLNPLFFPSGCQSSAALSPIVSVGFYLSFQSLWGSPGGSEVKASACNVEDLGLIPGSGRSPGEGDGYPLQYSCMENSMDRETWQATIHGVARVGHNLVTKPQPEEPDGLQSIESQRLRHD